MGCDSEEDVGLYRKAAESCEDGERDEQVIQDYG